MAKRLFDIFFCLLLLLIFFWVLLFVWVLAIIDTRTNGIFIQERVGQFGTKFKIYKLRTIQISSKFEEASISRIGKFLRSFKLDELPQIFNVLKGEMSIVGPRPDIAGYYDLLKGGDRKVLELKPGLTSFASIKYFDEEHILVNKKNALDYNDKVIFPDKVKMNLEYYYNRSFLLDLKIIWLTIFRK